MSANTNRLYRSRTDRMLGGVCSGLGRFFGIDPTIVRLVAIILLLVFHMVTVIGYMLLWVIVPQEPLAPSAEVINTTTAPVPPSDEPAAPAE